LITSPQENETVNGTIIIEGIAADPDGNETLDCVEVRIDDDIWYNAIGTTSWSYSWDTTTVANGSHTIFARSFDGELYSSLFLVNVTVMNDLPTVTIAGVSGGFRVSATITNTGVETVYNVPWSIDLTKGFILVGRHTEDVIEELQGGESKTVTQKSLFGIGTTNIIVTAGSATETASGFVLGPLVLGVG